MQKPFVVGNLSEIAGIKLKSITFGCFMFAPINKFDMNHVSKPKS